MSKKKRNNTNQVQQNNFDSHEYEYVPATQHSQQHYPVPVPEVVNMDVTALLLDDELYSRLNLLESDRLKVLDARLDPLLWEVEIAYLRREIGIRKLRREAHEKYLQEVIAMYPEEEIVEFDDVRYAGSNPN